MCVMQTEYTVSTGQCNKDAVRGCLACEITQYVFVNVVYSFENIARYGKDLSDAIVRFFFTLVGIDVKTR